MDKIKIDEAIENLCGLNNLEWHKVRRIVDGYFESKTQKIADKLEFTDDEDLKNVMKIFNK